jgi:hypothetical protein
MNDADDVTDRYAGWWRPVVPVDRMDMSSEYGTEQGKIETREWRKRQTTLKNVKDERMTKRAQQNENNIHEGVSVF